MSALPAPCSHDKLAFTTAGDIICVASFDCRAVWKPATPQAVSPKDHRIRVSQATVNDPKWFWRTTD